MSEDAAGKYDPAQFPPGFFDEEFLSFVRERIEALAAEDRREAERKKSPRKRKEATIPSAG